MKCKFIIWLLVVFFQTAQVSFSQNYETDLIPFLKATGKWVYARASDQSIAMNQEFEDANLFIDGYAVVKRNGKYGVIDKKGVVKIPFKYNYIFRNSGKFISDTNSKGVKAPEHTTYELGLDGSEKLITYFASNFYENKITFQSNNKVGFMDKNKKIVIPAKFDYAYGFAKGYAVVFLNRKQGLIDSNGNFVIPPIYEYLVYNPDHDLLYAKNDKYKIGFIDKKGKVIIDFQYEYTDNGFTGNYISVKGDNDKFGIIDQKGNYVLPLIYDTYISIRNQRFVASKEGKLGLIDSNNKILLPFEYDYIWDGDNYSFITVSKNKKVAVLNQAFEIVLPYKYEMISRLDTEDQTIRLDDLAVAQKDGKYGLINYKDEVFVPFQWDEIEEFYPNKAYLLVKKDGKFGLITKNNQVVIQPLYSEIQNFINGYAYVVNEYFENIYVDTLGRAFVEN